MKNKMTTTRETHLLEAARELADTLYRWNVIDDAFLVVQDDRNGGTPYYHLDQALCSVLRLLGTENKMDFYETVTLGASAREALEHAKEQERGYDS
jgi:hypothetical protein